MKNTILGVVISLVVFWFYRWINQPPGCDDPIQAVYSEERKTQKNVPTLKFNIELDGGKLAQNLVSGGIEAEWDRSTSSVKILEPGTDLSRFAQKVALLNTKYKTQKLCNEPVDGKLMQAWLKELNALAPGKVPPQAKPAPRQTYFKKTLDGGFQGSFVGNADRIEIRIFGFDRDGQKIYCHPVVVNKCCFEYFEIPAEKLWLQDQQWEYEVVAIFDDTEKVVG